MNTFHTSLSPSTNQPRDVTEVVGRFPLASLYTLSGFGKGRAYTATAGYLDGMNLPPSHQSSRIQTAGWR